MLRPFAFNVINDVDRAKFVIMLSIFFIFPVSFAVLLFLPSYHSANDGNVAMPNVPFLAKILSLGLLIKHSSGNELQDYWGHDCDYS